MKNCIRILVAIVTLLVGGVTFIFIVRDENFNESMMIHDDLIHKRSMITHLRDEKEAIESEIMRRTMFHLRFGTTADFSSPGLQARLLTEEMENTLLPTSLAADRLIVQLSCSQIIDADKELSLFKERVADLNLEIKALHRNLTGR